MSKPLICYTYDHNDIELFNTVVPLVDCIETTADTISYIKNGKPVLNENIIQQLNSVAQTKRILSHGVGLTIGSYSGYSEAYLRLMDELCKQVNLYWHSEHLGFTSVDGENLNIMLPVNKNEEGLNMICERVMQIQERYSIPFLLENIAHLLPDYDAQYSEAGFLNEIVKRTGCGLILDTYNIACDEHNYNFNFTSFMEELNADAVREIHLANGSIYKNRMLDIHSNSVSAVVLEKTKSILPRLKNLEVITYELMPEAVPNMGYQNIRSELIRLRHYFEI